MPSNRPTMEEWGKALYEAAGDSVKITTTTVKPATTSTTSTTSTITRTRTTRVAPTTTTTPVSTYTPRSNASGYNTVSKKPDNHLVWAILTTILCCLPTGIVAIVKACKVNTLWYQGLHDEAIKASEDAKKWSIYGVILYFIFTVLMMITSAY